MCGTGVIRLPEIIGPWVLLYSFLFFFLDFVLLLKLPDLASELYLK